MILRQVAGLAVCGMLALGSSPVFAHHSTSMYNMANPVTVTGTVTRFEWTNPHASRMRAERSSSGKSR